jgi:hypothetical protein
MSNGDTPGLFFVWAATQSFSEAETLASHDGWNESMIWAGNQVEEELWAELDHLQEVTLTAGQVRDAVRNLPARDFNQWWNNQTIHGNQQRGVAKAGWDQSIVELADAVINRLFPGMPDAQEITNTVRWFRREIQTAIAYVVD